MTESENPIKRSDVATPSDVRRVLALSKEEKAEIKKEQDKLLKLHRSRARLSPEERKLARGIELERHFRQTKNKNGLAEALAMQGKYEEAAKVAQTADLKKSLREKRDAVNSADADCQCDTYYQTGGGVMLPNQHVESYGYSEKHKKVMPFIRCKCCRKLNARPMLSHLAEQRKMRRKSERGEEVRADALFIKR